MKFRITFKTPDAVSDAIDDHGFAPNRNDSEEQADAKYEFASKMKKVADKFVSYGECVTLEFDTDTQTCEVVSKQ
jgi:hypothetical protein